MLRLFGVPVKYGDARALVAALLADGSDDAVAAAGLIDVAIRRRLAGLVLSAELRTAIVVVALDKAPAGLIDLRERLRYPRRGAGNPDRLTPCPRRIAGRDATTVVGCRDPSLPALPLAPGRNGGARARPGRAAVHPGAGSHARRLRGSVVRPLRTGRREHRREAFAIMRRRRELLRSCARAGDRPRRAHRGARYRSLRRRREGEGSRPPPCTCSPTGRSPSWVRCASSS